VQQRCACCVGQAAELRASGEVASAAHVIERLLQVSPQHPRALFAMGQLQGMLARWRDAEQAYTAAAKLEDDATQRSRAWLGAGVALQMQVDVCAIATRLS
jgi:cytochrome c-type biogenesis protein CcmH/NrfG